MAVATIVPQWRPNWPAGLVYAEQPVILWHPTIMSDWPCGAPIMDLHSTCRGTVSRPTGSPGIFVIRSLAAGDYNEALPLCNACAERAAPHLWALLQKAGE